MSNRWFIYDHSVNGHLGTIVDTKQDSSGILNQIYVKFEDENVGLTKMSYGQFYAALNRVKSLGNLYIEGQVTKEAFNVDRNVEIFQTKSTILFNNITNCRWIYSWISQYQITL